MATDAKTAAESLIPLFQFGKILNQDQNGRRLSLLGSIHDQPALMTLERAAFPSDASLVNTLLSRITDISNLGSNDIYRWYMASHALPKATSSRGPEDVVGQPRAPDLKLNLIYPCTEAHIKKYSPQPVRMVTETPDIYAHRVRPYMRQKREEGRLNWVYNILDGKTEQEDVILREHSRSWDPDATGGGREEEQDKAGDGFLLLPDLNWDRETAESLRLLVLVERRDIWSLRDLKKRHVAWLKHMREKILKATVEIYGSKGVEEDMLKLYVHYQPTYYHFHIHVTNVMSEPGITQATGKAFGLENIISQLESLAGNEEAGMADVSLTYFLGEASELWEGIFRPLKDGRQPVVPGR